MHQLLRQSRDSYNAYKKGSQILCIVRVVSPHSREEKNSPNYSTSLMILSRGILSKNHGKPLKTVDASTMKKRRKTGTREELCRVYCVCICVYVRKRRATYVYVQTRGRDRRCEIAEKDRRRKERE